MPTKNLAHTKTVLLVIDMQEDVWRVKAPSETITPYIPNALRDFQEKNNTAEEGGREEAVKNLVSDMEGFIQDMRNNGAEIVLSLNDETPASFLRGTTLDKDGDDFIVRTGAISVYEETLVDEEGCVDNKFTRLKNQAELSGETLEIKLCGVWADGAIHDTLIALSDADFNVQVVNDMVLHSSLSGTNPVERKLENLGRAIGENISVSSEEVFKKQRDIFNAKVPSSQEPSLI